MRVVYAIADASLSTRYGGHIWVAKGTHWDAEDPLVKANQQLFSDDPATGLSTSADQPPIAGRVIIGPDAEQMTAAPGERRIRPEPRERIRG